MRRTQAFIVAIVTALFALFANAAFGATSSTTTIVTANLAAPAGTRVLSPVATPAALNFTSGLTAVTDLTVVVVEALADGVNNWYVTAESSQFSSVGGGSIPASSLALNGLAASVTSIGDLAGTPNSGAGGTLDQATTMFTVSGESPGMFPGYTGTYTGTGQL